MMGALDSTAAVIPLPRLRDYSLHDGPRAVNVMAYDGVIVTDREQAFIDTTRRVSTDDLARLSRVMVAMSAGIWPLTPEQTAALPIDQIRAAIDSLAF